MIHHLPLEAPASASSGRNLDFSFVLSPWYQQVLIQVASGHLFSTTVVSPWQSSHPQGGRIQHSVGKDQTLDSQSICLSVLPPPWEFFVLGLYSPISNMRTIEPESIPKTAVVAPYGLFCMLFGLQNTATLLSLRFFLCVCCICSCLSSFVISCFHFCFLCRANPCYQVQLVSEPQHSVIKVQRKKTLQHCSNSTPVYTWTIS